MTRTNESKTQPYDPTWWSALCDEWNTHACKGDLAGLGTVCFVVTDRDGPDTWIDWDETGTARMSAPDESAPCFRANTKVWLRFVEGELSAAEGVLSGQITFVGNLRTILPYVDAFNNLGSAARRI
jgi:SCP-2 sterol transfer family